MLNCLLVSTVEIVVAVMAVIVAIASAVIALIFGLSQRKHNINSVRPIPSLIVGDYDNDIYIKLKNVGTGPLIIKKLRFRREGMEAEDLIALLFDARKYIDTYNSKSQYKQQYWETYINGTLDDSPMGINEEVILIRIKPLNEEIREVLKSAISKISLKLEYLDIYKKHFVYGPHSFESFGKDDGFLN